MRKYELSISADYVPSWGIVEAVREFFQNSIDEETRDDSNKMFFRYDADTETFQIGNKHSELDIKTLLFGTTTKSDDKDMIGCHGEGYKIATTVLLRCGKTVVFNNYCRREIWRPRLVKSRKYDGMMVPTFFVETSAVWEKVPEHSLVIEIGGITTEEYEQIKVSNLHMQEYEKISTYYGDILKDEKYVGKVFTGGLYICEEPRLDIGVDFKPCFVKLERDRSMVDSFDVQWYSSKMVEQVKDAELVKKSLNSYSGYYVNSSCVPMDLKNEIAEDFINEFGAKAVPVASQDDMDGMKKRGYRPVIVTKAKQKVILESEYFEDAAEENRRIQEAQRPLYDRFAEFIERIEDRLDEDEVTEIYGILDEIESRAEETEGETEESHESS
ncbi:MAG: hypothetical protein LUG62_01170 [Clostridiales bacterium]|nr:hypothetical protein [Clostridiales bacterium]